jgi:hypothetical protein
LVKTTQFHSSFHILKVLTKFASYFYFFKELINSEDDEVLFAIAEELGKVFTLINDKTVFLPLLEDLAKQDETVVRE